MTRHPVLLLDVMGTLVYDPFDHEVPAHFGMTQSELLSQVKPGTWVRFELGEIDEATLEREYFADGRSYDHAGLVARMRAAYRWMPGMEALARELKHAGHQLHALSNYPEWWRAIEEVLGMGELVPWTFVSCRMGLRKPDPAIYRAAAEELGVEPERCLFVDDREVNCEGARSVGMDAIRFEDAARLRDALVERGVLTRE